MLSRYTFRKAAAFLAVAIVLATTVAASPSDLQLELDEAPSLVARAAGGKYVGVQCTTSSECYSENCVGATPTAPGTCQRQPVGGFCFKNANCLTWNCNTISKKCRSTSKLYGVCGKPDTSCATGLDCVDGSCRYSAGTTCKYDKQCSSKRCISGKCSGPSGLLAPNAQCTEDSECLSGQCVYSTCENSDGTYGECPQVYIGNGYFTDSSVCARYPLGHTCANQGDCAQGRCTNGTCVAGKEGDTCANDTDCPTNAICLSKKCTTPAAASVFPRGLCGADNQCVSGSCVLPNSIAPKDSEGVNGGFYLYSKRYVKFPGITSQCDYLGEDQKGCRSLFDCDTQLCKSGVCKSGVVGDTCTINAQCASRVCSLQGKCIDPPAGADLAPYQPAANANQCLTNRLSFELINPLLKRPSLNDPSVLAKEFDFACLPALANGPCKVNSDCDSGNCGNGACIGGATEETIPGRR